MKTNLSELLRELVIRNRRELSMKDQALISQCARELELAELQRSELFRGLVAMHENALLG